MSQIYAGRGGFVVGIAHSRCCPGPWGERDRPAIEGLADLTLSKSQC